jgi:hypothetical protein
MAKRSTKRPSKKVTEVDALLSIAKAINRLAVAAEIIASPPPPFATAPPPVYAKEVDHSQVEPPMQE